MCGSKIFSLNDSHVSVIEVALSIPLYQYLEKKYFKYVNISFDINIKLFLLITFKIILTY